MGERNGEGRVTVPAGRLPRRSISLRVRPGAGRVFRLSRRPVHRRLGNSNVVFENSSSVYVLQPRSAGVYTPAAMGHL